MKIIIFGSGRGSNMQSIHKAITDQRLDAEISRVITNNPQAKLLEYCQDNGISTSVIDHHDFSSREEHEEQINQLIDTIDHDLIVLAGYMRILSASFIEKHPRIVNIHPSLLPSFRGMNAQQQALEYGVKVTGVTIHQVSKDVDAGRILGQRCVSVEHDDTVDSLSDRILQVEHQLYPDVLQGIADGSIELQETK